MSSPIPPEWRTHAETTDYRETPNYDDTVAYARRLAARFTVNRISRLRSQRTGPRTAAGDRFGNATFTAEAATSEGKAVVLIQACIHSGEPDGKDAGFALLRDIAITKTAAGILENVVLLFIPIYNTDGHERSTPIQSHQSKRSGGDGLAHHQHVPKPQPRLHESRHARNTCLAQTVERVGPGSLHRLPRH